MTLLRLMIRRNRLVLGCWVVLLVGLSGGTVSAYQTTYVTADQRRAATDLAQHNAAGTLMYGRLLDPGTPAQMFAWEVGAIVTLLAAVAAVLLAVTLTRAAEDDGTLELVRSCGTDPRTPLRTALALLSGAAAVLAAGGTAAVALVARDVEGVDLTGAAAYGSVVGLTFLLFAVLTAGLAQVAATAGQARLLGFAAVTVAFAVRALADTRDAGWLAWFTPLGLRATVRPFTDDRPAALVAGLLAAAVLAWLAGATARRREYGAGLIRRRTARDTRLRTRTVTGLAVRLTRGTVLIWTVAVAGFTGLFCAMGSGSVEQSRTGDLGGFLGGQLGAGDPVAGYLAYSGTVTGMVVSVFGIRTVLAAARDERAGLTGHLLAAGARRWAPLAAQAVVTGAGSAVILTAAGAVSALVAPAVLDGTEVAGRSFAFLVGQWPAVAALTGFATLLAGMAPRWTGLAWLPLAAGGLIALLGPLLRIPEAVQRLGVFQHVPDVAAPGPAGGGLLLLVAVAAGTAVAGVRHAGRRDVIGT